MINQALILVGGKGTRLGKLTKKNPKPLLQVNQKPFLDFVINFLLKFKIKKILLLTKFKHEKFKKLYDKKKIGKTIIKCVPEKEYLGTSGALKNVINKLDKKFIMCNGDTVFNINLFNFISKLKKKYIGILACSSLQNNIKRYSNFSSKSKKIISSGIYLFQRDKIKKYLISPGSIENDVLKNLPKKLFKKVCYKEKFLDIGIPKDFNRAEKFLNKTFKRKCVFLDRDGVINYDYGYVYKKKDFKWKKNVIPAIRLLNKNGYLVIVVSNQSGVGRGFYSVDDVSKLHIWINKQLSSKGAYIDKFYFSPFYKNSYYKKFRIGGEYRKPNIGMFNKAVRDFKIDKKISYFIGDKDSDKNAAKKFKVKYYNVDNNTDLYNLIKNKLNIN